jgi:hopanoid biosynthesis associated protein HpnK
VEAAHREGMLSAASLMVGGPAAADAVARAHRLPNLRVGLHLVLVDGDPILHRAEIPDLVDRRGRLRNDLARFGMQIMINDSVRRQVDTEIAAQFETFAATGLTLDHVNAHRHFQLHPAVAATIIAIGPRYRMHALRVPVEPLRILTDIDPRTQRGLSFVTAPWTSLLRHRARSSGLRIADAVFGLAWTGAMTAARLAALLARLPCGLVEIYLHPARSSAFAGAAPDYRYAEEFAALCDPACKTALRAAGCTLGGYADAASG